MRNKHVSRSLFWLAARIERLARRTEPELVWMLQCEHKYPNFVQCPYGCDPR